MYCIYCGEKNPSDARFCGNCGRPTVTPVWHGKRLSETPEKEFSRVLPSNKTSQLTKRILPRSGQDNNEKTIALIAALLFVAVICLDLLRHLQLSSWFLYVLHYTGYVIIVVGLFSQRYSVSASGFISLAIVSAIRAYEYSKGAFGISDFLFDQEVQCIVLCISYFLIIFGISLSGRPSRLFSITALLIRMGFRALLLVDALYFSRSTLRDIVEILALIAICVLRWRKNKTLDENL